MASQKQRKVSPNSWIGLIAAKTPKLTRRDVVILAIPVLVILGVLGYAEFGNRLRKALELSPMEPAARRDHEMGRPTVYSHNNSGIINTGEFKGNIHFHESNAYINKSYVVGDRPDAVIAIAKRKDGTGIHYALGVLKLAFNPKVGTQDIEKYGREMQTSQYFVNSHTEVRILDDTEEAEERGETAPIRGDALTKVEILEGKHKGKVGWVLTQLIKTEERIKTE